MDLSFTIAAEPRQRSDTQIRGPAGLWSYFTVSDVRSPESAGPGSHIYIPKEQGGPIIPPGRWFPFRRILRLTGLWWRYSIPPPQIELYLNFMQIRGQLEEDRCESTLSLPNNFQYQIS